MADLKLAASTFSYIYTENGLEASLHLADMGFEAIEMIVFAPHCWPPLLTATERKAYQEQLAARGLSLSSFCYPLLDNNPNAPDALMRRYTLDRYREHIDLAAEWGCPYVVAIPGPVNSLIDPPYAWMLNWFVEGVKELVAHAKGTGVEILIENVPFTFLPTVDDMLKVLDLVGEPSVGVNSTSATRPSSRRTRRPPSGSSDPGAGTSTSPTAASTSSSITGSASRAASSTPRRWPQRFATSATRAIRCSRSSPTRSCPTARRTRTSWRATPFSASTAGRTCESRRTCTGTSFAAATRFR